NLVAMNKDILCYRKGERVAGIGIDVAILAVVGIGGYFAFKFLADKFTSDADRAAQANSAAVEANTPAALQSSLTAAQATGQKPTLPDATFNDLANTIALSVQAGADDTNLADDAFWAAQTVNNKVDWYTLIKTFGVRKDSRYNSVDMVTGLKEVLSKSQ